MRSLSKTAIGKFAKEEVLALELKRMSDGEKSSV
jgi:hypothetical protein